MWSLSLFESRRMLTVLGLMKTREKLLRGIIGKNCPGSLICQTSLPISDFAAILMCSAIT